MKKQEILSELTAWLQRFNVSEYMDKKVEELSKGNQQKIQFISAVLHQPDFLILDEPFSGLDPINVELMKEAVIDLNRKGTTIVLDRKSTRLNSSHVSISYAVFCLKK